MSNLCPFPVLGSEWKGGLGGMHRLKCLRKWTQQFDSDRTATLVVSNYSWCFLPSVGYSFLCRALPEPTLDWASLTAQQKWEGQGPQCLFFSFLGWLPHPTLLLPSKPDGGPGEQLLLMVQSGTVPSILTYPLTKTLAAPLC